jgi:hypothetical protein
MMNVIKFFCTCLHCRFFEDAALKLNLKALVAFLCELCASSRQQLSALDKKYMPDILSLPPYTLLLYRFDAILSKCIASNRPRLHVMCIWHIIAPHLVEVNNRSPDIPVAYAVMHITVDHSHISQL